MTSAFDLFAQKTIATVGTAFDGLFVVELRSVDTHNTYFILTSASIEPERAGRMFCYFLNAVPALVADTAVFFSYGVCKSFTMNHFKLR